MYISIVAPAIWDTVHWDFACALHALGHRVAVYTEDRSARSGWRFERSVRSGIECYVISDSRRNPWMWLLDRLAKPWLGRRFFTTLSAVHRFLKETAERDVCLCEGDWMGVFVALGGSKQARWLVSVHDTLYLRGRISYRGRPRSRWRQAAKSWVLRRASLVRANSEVTKEALIDGGCDPAKIAVVPLPVSHWMRLAADVDLDRLRGDARAQLRPRYGIPADAPLCVVMCRLDPAKGLELAIDALAAADQRIWLLVCGGDRSVEGLGSYRRHLEALARNAGIGGRIVFAGHVERDRVKHHLAMADLHLAPSVIDTFNYGVVEAAIVGTPSLMSDRVGAGPWIVAAGGGEVLGGRDPAGWARRIGELASRPLDSAARRAIGAAVLRALDPAAVAAELVRRLARPG